MKSNGKLLEHTVELIHRSLANIPNTKVFRNKKIKSPNGNSREFDVIITSLINGLEIKIAIECKDYSSKVSAEKIEAFNSKCVLVKGIHKKVFIAAKGFQPSAVEASETFEVDLFNASKLTADQVRNWLGLEIFQLGFKVLRPFKNIVFFLETEDEEFVSKTSKTFDGNLYWEKGSDALNIHQVLHNEFNANRRFVFKYGLIEWMRRGNTPEPFPLPFQLNFNEVVINGYNGDPVKLLGISAEIEVQFPATSAAILDAREFSEFDGTLKANSVSFDVGQGAIGSVVSSDGNSDFYYTKKDGETVKLKTLLLYDPKSDKFSIPEG